MIRIALFTAFALVAATGANAASAADDTQLPSVNVSYQDLNLAAAAGIERFKRRIDHAAADVCAGTGSSASAHYSLRDDAMFRACRRVALANVQPQVIAAIQHASNLASNGAPIVLAAR